MYLFFEQDIAGRPEHKHHNLQQFAMRWGPHVIIKLEKIRSDQMTKQGNTLGRIN